mmetsp:Transcript_40849/g.131381  ORF Transcript_40849/g.131381 Transcript_40849/m.131381 type:complete len:357 (-) Transcript_40849:1665-2735(-)
MVGVGFGNFFLLFFVLGLNQRTHPEDVVPLRAMQPTTGHLQPRRAQVLCREVFNCRHERLSVDLALPGNCLPEDIRGGVIILLLQREVEVEEELLAQPLVGDDAGEVPAAEQVLVCAPGNPKEVHLLQVVVLAVVNHGDDPRHQRQERRDANSSSDRNEDMTIERGGHGGSVGAVHGNHRELGSELVLVVQTLLGQGAGPIANAGHDEVHGVVLLAGHDRERVPLVEGVLGQVDEGVHPRAEVPQVRRLRDLQKGQGAIGPTLLASTDNCRSNIMAFEQVVTQQPQDAIHAIDADGNDAEGQNQRNAKAEPTLAAVKEEENDEEHHPDIVDELEEFEILLPSLLYSRVPHEGDHGQ